MKWVEQGLRILIAVAFAAAAVVKLIDLSGSTARFASWGYPQWVLFAVIAAEAAGAIGLLIGRTVDLAAGALLLLMVAALFTLYQYGDSLTGATPAIVLLVLLALLILLRRRERSLISL